MASKNPNPTVIDTPVKEEKKKKVELKGDVLKLKDIAGTDFSGPVKLIKSAWGGRYHNLREIFYCTKITKNIYRADEYVIESVDTKTGYKNPSHIISDPNGDLTLKRLTGTTGQSLAEEYHKIIRSNLSGILSLPRRIGADPEIFVEDEHGNNIPAFLFLGSKEKPDHTANDTIYGNHTMYWDGFQAEFTTHNDTCLGWVSDSIFCGIKGIYNAAKNFNKNAKLSAKTLIEVPIETLMATKPEYVEFGCKPSFNAYGLESDIGIGAFNIPYRSAGGHLHFGLGKLTKEKAEPMVKALDAILGVACVSLFEGYDHPVRRRYYGLAGEYRLPPHGLEYRVLSNAWLFHPVLMNLVFDIGRVACNIGNAGLLKDVWEASEQDTINTIMGCDVEKAREILKKNKEVFKTIMKAAYPGIATNAHEVGFNFFLKGMGSGIEDPTNLEKNWNLKRPWVTHCGGVNMSWSSASVTLGKGTKI